MGRGARIPHADQRDERACCPCDERDRRRSGEDNDADDEDDANADGHLVNLHATTTCTSNTWHNK